MLGEGQLHYPAEAELLGFLWLSVRPTTMRPGLLTSVGAAYTPDELCALLNQTRLKSACVRANVINGSVVTLRGHLHMAFNCLMRRETFCETKIQPPANSLQPAQFPDAFV